MMRGRSSAFLLIAGLGLAGCVLPEDDAPQAAMRWEPEEHLDEIEGAAAVLDNEAQQRWPAEFSGTWIDRGAIWVAFTEDPQAKVDELRRAIQQPHPVRPLASKRSLRDLVALQDRMGADRSTLQRNVMPDAMPAPIVETAGVYDLDIDIRRGVVVVSVEDLTPELRQGFLDRYDSDAITFEEGVAAPG